MTAAQPQIAGSASSLPAELILLPPEAADQLSAAQRAWLEAALMGDPRCSLEGTLAAVREERAQLWAVRDGPSLRALVVTRIARYERCSALEIQLCGGEGLRDWVALLAELEGHARALGCRLVELRGRVGWRRALRAYRVRGLALEREI